MGSKLQIRLYGLITLINVVLGVAVGEILHSIWPQHYFDWYPSIPCFYWIVAMAMVFFLDRVRKKKGDVSITTYMLVRLCKFLLACAFLAVYAELIGTKLEVFGIVLMLFYFIYLTLEVYTIYLYEKKRMNREKREKNEQVNQ